MNKLNPIDIVEYDGKRFHLGQLAHYMDNEQREAIHSRPEWKEGDAQDFWAAFCERFPEEAAHLAEITPPIFNE